MRGGAWIGAVCLAVFWVVAWPGQGAALADQQVQEEQVIVSLTVNSRRVDENALVLRRGDVFFVAKGALADARVVVGPDARTIAGPGTEYVDLSSLTGVKVSFDGGAQDLRLEVEARRLEVEAVDLTKPIPVTVTPPDFGGFINYNLVGQAGTDPAYLAAITDAGLYVGGGTLLSSALLRGGQEQGAIRLDTSYVRDFPDELVRMTVGDAITRGGDWGRPYRFGGIQIGTNFSTQPGFVPYPLPTFAGQAALPSTVDVFVNDALRYRGTVDQGPFSLNQIPALVGGGQARVVLTDPLGQQQVSTLAFNITPQLLREGLSDFSYEIGFVRTGYQQTSDGYGDFTVSGTQRYGLSDELTLEGHAEATNARGVAGASLTQDLGFLGNLNTELAGGSGADGGGWLAGIGLARTSRDWSFSLSQRWLSQKFDRARPVLSAIGAAERSEGTASASLSLPHWGSFTASLTHQSYEGTDAATIGSLYWNIPIRDSMFLSAYAIDTRQGEHVTTIGLTLTLQLGRGSAASLESYNRGGVWGANEQVRFAPETNRGWNWGADAAQGDLWRFGANATDMTDYGDFGLAVDHINGASDARFTASGGLAFVEDKVFATRRIDDSFAVASVPGHPGVEVLQENRPAGKTDQDGDVFLPRLISNYPNKISIDPADFALDTDLPEVDQNVTPSYRSATHIIFNAQTTRAMLLTVRHADGSLIDYGLPVLRRRDKERFYSGFDGAVYLNGDPDDMFDVTEVGGGTCHFALPAKVPAGQSASVTCEAAP
jgi:outer membrane usher protein